jgi:hypothetical protein
MHELGHVLGLDAIAPAFAPHDLLTETLGLGVRRLPVCTGGWDAVALAASSPAPVTAHVQGALQTQALATAPALAIEGQVPVLRSQERIAVLRSIAKRRSWVEANDVYFQARDGTQEA